MRAALSIASAPVVFGMRRDIVEWSLTGLVPNAISVKSALVSPTPFRLVGSLVRRAA